MAGKQDDRQFRVVTLDRGRQFQPADPGHLDVRDDHGEVVLADELQRVFAIRSDLDFQTAQGQAFGQRGDQLLFVVDNQYPERFHVSQLRLVTGSRTVKLAPSPGVLCTSSCPPSFATMPSVIDSPNPVPCSAFVVKNGSKI